MKNNEKIKMEEKLEALVLNDAEKMQIEITAPKHPKSFLPLSPIIKSEIAKHISSIKCILDNSARDYMLRELLSSYNQEEIKKKVGNWIYDNYDKNLHALDYNDLLSANTTLTELIGGGSYFINDETKCLYFEQGGDWDELRSMIHSSVIHEFITLSSLPVEIVSSLGEVYEQFL